MVFDKISDEEKKSLIYSLIKEIEIFPCDESELPLSNTLCACMYAIDRRFQSGQSVSKIARFHPILQQTGQIDKTGNNPAN